MSDLLYLHGHPSSPISAKPVFFTVECSKMGWDLQVPALADASGQSVSITDQLAKLAKEVLTKPKVVIGSSLGAYLARLYAAVHTEVQGVVLLAPSIDLDETLKNMRVEDRQKYKLTASFVEDQKSYPSEPEFTQRALIFHGKRDTLRSLQYSREHARRRGSTLTRQHVF